MTKSADQDEAEEEAAFIKAIRDGAAEIDRIRKNVCIKAVLGSKEDEVALRGIIGDADYETMCKAVMKDGALELLALAEAKVEKDADADVEGTLDLAEQLLDAATLAVPARKSLEGQEDSPGTQVEPEPAPKRGFQFFTRHSGSVHSNLRG